MAERVRFELTNPAKGLQFSRLVYSTALPSLRGQFYWKPNGRSTPFLFLVSALVSCFDYDFSTLYVLRHSYIFEGRLGP